MTVTFISKGKGRKKKVIPINNTKKSVRSVSLNNQAIKKVNKEQGVLLKQGETANFSKALNTVIMRAKREGIPIYDINVNQSDAEGEKQPFLMWITDMKTHSKVKGSDTIVFAEHYGQAVDDFITLWNKVSRMNMDIGYPVVQGTAFNPFTNEAQDVFLTEDDKKQRKKRNEIRTIRDLDGREDFDLVQVDTDIDHFHEFLGIKKGTYDGLFIKVKDGDVVEAYGYNGSVPALDLGVDRIETPNEKLEKKFGKRKARLVDSIKHGSKVTILTQQGQKISGRAVMKSSLGDNSWVLNTGGAHGRTAIASDENVIKVVG